MWWVIVQESRSARENELSVIRLMDRLTFARIACKATVVAVVIGALGFLS